MIVIGSDHGGYKLKEEIKKFLDEKGLKYEDKGAFSEDSVDYPSIAKEVAGDVSKNKADIRNFNLQVWNWNVYVCK